MGNRFQLSAVAGKKEFADKCIDAAIHKIQRIEKLLTTYNDDSETALINKNAGVEPVSVSMETFNIVERSIRISGITQGAFDITYGSVDKRLWNFDSNMKELPDKETAKKMVRLINYRNIIVDKEKTTVFLKEKGMRIGFGGIGKGYAAEKARQVMRERGVESGIVNASGDLATWGYQPNGKPWTIGIVDPNAKVHAFSYLNITDIAIATSGNYENILWSTAKNILIPLTPVQGFLSGE
jgi:FAD:protein FMN transferase